MPELGLGKNEMIRTLNGYGGHLPPLEKDPHTTKGDTS